MTMYSEDVVDSEFLFSGWLTLRDGNWGIEHDLPTTIERLVEVSLHVNGKPVETDPEVSLIFLQPSNGGTWRNGTPAEEKRSQLAEERERVFSVPIGSYDEGLIHFYVVALLENIQLSRVMRVPGIELIPLAESNLGQDAAELLNAVIAQMGFTHGIDPSAWVHMLNVRRPAAILRASEVRANDANSAIEAVYSAATKLIDLITFLRDARPKIIGGIIGQQIDQSLQYHNFWIAGSSYSGNRLSGFLAGESPHALVNHWSNLDKDSRTELWLSLFSDALHDERWDYKVFRLFNLLEGAAKELLSSKTVVADATGTALLMDDGKPYTVKQARGAVFMLLRRVAQNAGVSESSFVSNAVMQTPLWDEVKVWTSVRNAVAHRGSWRRSTGTPLTKSDREIEDYFRSVGHDGSLESGINATIQALREAVKTFIRIALLGKADTLH
ncbi:hypothetical protein [Amycolatopsis thermoflava]|uniref:hypothetical protein n=1 Tax=Amycolatopsis thermoflava TaxID=84480 RepID=UPI0011CDF94A|nr:hypothetical protein [Amycolatopsis thermoflava]